MSTTPCPSCGMPRAEELIGAPCPVCAYVGPPESPPEEAAAAEELPFADPEPVAAAESRSWFGAMLGVSAFAAGALAGVGGLVAWQSNRTPTPLPPDGPPAVAAAAPASPVPAVIRPPAAPPPPPAPRTTPLADVIAPAPPAAPQAAPVVPPPAAEPRPVVNPVAPPQPVPAGQAAPPNPFRPAAPLAVRVDNPAGETTVVVDPGRTRIVRGKVRVLKVPGLEAGATLDCSDLDVEEVVVSGKIDGGSKLWVKAPNGRVTFLARIDGRSRVEVRAPGGLVNFAPPAEPRLEGGRIEGGATVEVVAKAVTFHGRVHGGGTVVTAILTEGGSLTFAEVDGPAKLHYRRDDPEDPHPAVNPGRIGPGAEVRRLRDPDE